MPRSGPARRLVQAACAATLACTACTPPSPARPAGPPGPAILTTREGTRLGFDRSPGGDSIVFDLLGQLWIVSARGGPARPLTDAVRDTAEDLDPEISPDGTQIAFWSDRPGGKGIWVLSRGDGAVRPLATSPSPHDRIRDPAWAPGGDRIAFTNRDSLHVLDLAGGAVRAVRIEGLPARPVRDPTWSPDGRRIAFVNAAGWSSLGGRIWEVDAEGGAAVPLVPEGARGLAPAYSPDGGRVAFVSYDSARVAQVWVREADADAPGPVTDHADVAPTRVRWSADGASLLYAADGRLWRRHLAAATPETIPFVASLRIPRPAHAHAALRFPPPGSELPARGHAGLALSPDGDRIALLALGRLWVGPVGGEPQAVAPVPPTAGGLAWSPSGREVVWSAGPGGAEDLYATDLLSGATRQVTSLPGREEHPSWSPDGRHIAFLHWQKPALPTAPSEYEDAGVRLRVLAVDRAPVGRVEETRDLGDVPGGWNFRFFGLGQEAPQWSPAADEILLFDEGGDGPQAFLVSLDGASRPLDGFPARATFVRWGADSALVFVRDNALWRAPVRGEPPRVEEPVALSDDPALYPRVSRDGAVLYLSADGLRLRAPDGRVERLGWPLTFTTPAAPPLLVRGVRIIDGTGTAPGAPSDVLVRDGRIARIAPAGRIRPPRGVAVLDAGGRFAIPGLIELHGHGWDDAVLPAALYFGITTLRDMGSPIGRMAAQRDAVLAGVLPGPRVVLGGFQVYPGSTGGSLSGANIQSPNTPEAGARALALARALGAEYAKMRFYASLPAGVRFVRQAHAAGLRVGGHCAHQLPLVAAGIDGKEHLAASCTDRSDGLLYDDLLQLFRGSGIAVTPTIEAFASVPRILADTTLLDDREVAAFLTPFARWWNLRLSPSSGRSYERFARTARTAAGTLHRAGVTLVTGSDAPTLPGSLHAELEELVAAGLSPLEAIAAATGTAARVLGAEHEIGTIRRGRWADLVILDADPTRDVRNTRRIWRVIQHGRLVDRSAVLASSAAAHRE